MTSSLGKNDAQINLIECKTMISLFREREMDFLFLIVCLHFPL